MSDRETAAAALVAARQAGRQLGTFPGEVPRGLETAYAIQDAAIQLIRLRLRGWKVAALPPADAERLGAPRIAGPLFETAVYASPASVAVPVHSKPGIEAEFGARLATDLPARPSPYTEEEVSKAVATLHPAIEVVGSCLRDVGALGSCAHVADFGGNLAFVYGPPIDGWRNLDVAGHEVRVRIGGAEPTVGHGADVPGGPIGALTWLANHLSARRRCLSAGDWISTGACGGMNLVDPTSVAVADFGNLGTVRVAFVA